MVKGNELFWPQLTENDKSQNMRTHHLRTLLCMPVYLYSYISIYIFKNYMAVV